MGKLSKLGEDAVFDQSPNLDVNKLRLRRTGSIMDSKIRNIMRAFKTSTCYLPEEELDKLKKYLGKRHCSQKCIQSMILESVTMKSLELVELFSAYSLENDEKSIIQAVILDASDILQLLKDRGFNPFVTRRLLEPPFCINTMDIALKHGSLKCAEILKDIMSPDHYYCVSEAIARNDLGCLKFLSNNYPREFRNVLTFSSAGFLHSAVENGNKEVVSLLARERADCNAVAQNRTPLMCALCPFIIDELVFHGADVNFEISNTLNGSTALLNAVSASFFTRVEVYLRKIGSCFDRVASIQRVLILVKTLVDHEADIEATNPQGNTALMLAAANGTYTNILEYLIKAGASIRHTNREGKTALHLAVKNNCIDNINILIQSGADLNSKCNMGFTPLHEAVIAGNVHAISILIVKRADLSLKDNKGNNPLHTAVSLGSQDVMQMICYSVSDFNDTNNNGDTALMLACQNLDLDAIQILDKMGADLTVVNETNNKTALDYVLNRKYDSKNRDKVSICAEYLLDRGAVTLKTTPYNFHLLLFERNISLIHKLIATGLKPSELELNLRDVTHHGSTVILSPLMFAVVCNEMEIAQYFYDIGFLTASDLQPGSCFETVESYVRQKGNMKSLQFLHHFSPRTATLQNFCFLAVSSAIGFGPKRESRIRGTGLPNVFQKKLLLKPDTLANSDVGRGSVRDDYRFEKVLSDFDRFCVAKPQ
ncbi:ankyrin-1-like [Physella acuta]|uniref:ankyrin-1-like n=1 Tax=Physella acuta TaxID=109671 RepID=UPI0027DB863B|nr:ankyrin-1-like [Physella acuta]XP_059144064.1 ankyrin-1-like [Physella acuta]